MGETVYKWKMNLYNVDAQAAGEYLKQLEKRDGEVKPSVIVEEARIPEAILHPVFEWDDERAADQYRVHQAKGIIRNIVVVYSREEKKEPVQVRAFVHSRDNETTEPRYIHIETALSDEALKRQLIQTAVRELNDFRKKYQNLVELVDVFSAINDAIEKIS